MDIYYRALRAQDEEDLKEFTKEVAGEVDFLPFTLNDVVHDEKILCIPAFLSIIAISEGKIIATAVIDRPSPLTRVKHRGTFAIVVKKEYWGRGIATNLARFAFEEAKRCFLTSLTSETLNSNVRFINFLKKMGFCEVGEDERMMVIDGEYVGGKIFKLSL